MAEKKLKTQNEKTKATRSSKLSEEKVKKTVTKKAAVKPAEKAPKVETKEAVVKKAAVGNASKNSSLKIRVLDTSGKDAGTIDVPAEIFGTTINKSLIAQAVRVYLANQRQGTHATKTRSEVSRTTKKPYRQKGTGRARHGSMKAHIWVGGGVAFGPTPRDYSLKMPQKMRRKALCCALSLQLKNENVVVLENVNSIKGKTKEFANVMKALNLTDKKGKAERVLFILPDDSKNVVQAGRNYQGVQLGRAATLNTYSVMSSRKVVFVKEALEALKNTVIGG